VTDVCTSPQIVATGLERPKPPGRGFPIGGVFNSALDAVIVMDAGGLVADWNPSAERTFGYTHADAVGRELADLIIPSDLRERHRNAFRRHLATGERVILDRRLELSAMRADGSLFRVELSVTRVESDPPLFAGFVRDISDRKKASDLIEEVNARFQGAFEHAPIGMALVSTSPGTLGQPLLVNSALSHLLGYSRERLLEMTLTDITHPDDVERNLDLVDKMIAGETDSYQTDKRFVRADGEVVRTNFTASVVRAADGSVSYGVVHLEDVTARRRAEELVEQSERWFRAVFATALDAVLVVDDDHRWVDANPAAADLLGIPQDQIRGQCAEDFTVPGSVSASTGWEQFLVDGERTGTFDVRRADGEIRNVEFSSRAHFVPGRHLSIVRDVTERRRAEESHQRLEAALNQAQRLDTVGQLAGGVAHDFNNLLAVIMHSTEFALAELDGAHPAAEEVREIRTAADRAAALTRQLLVFSRREVAQPQLLELNQVVTSIERLLGRAIGAHIRLETALAEVTPIVRVDPSQLEQVLMNLVVNARDAMPGGGRLRVETSLCMLAEDAASIAGLPSGRYARLVVTDTGSGMPEDVRQRAFEPFFTTKPKGAGTGLGLATTYGIARQNGGNVTIVSEEGVGTVITVLLPACNGLTDAEAPADPATATADRRRRVLLVEDEDGVRRVAERILAADGYDVVPAADAASAIRLAREQPPIDLVLTDVVMPEMSGTTLVARLREHDPELPAIFMSGYIDRPDELPEDAPLLAKPFSRDALLAQVAALLPVA
jgi:PAS domain S-box-containing protein